MKTNTAPLPTTALPDLLNSGAFFEREFPQRFDYELAFSRRYGEVEHLEPCAREAAMLAFQFPRIFQGVRPGDRLAGRIFYPKTAVGPQAVGVGYSCPIRELNRDLAQGRFSETTAQKARSLVGFWQSRRTQAKVRGAFAPEVTALLPSDEWAWESGESFPLYRIAGLQFSHERLLALGLPGLRGWVRAQAPANAVAFSNGLLAALDVLGETLRVYARETLQAASIAVDRDDRAAFAHIAADLTALRTQPPHTFSQACQLVWLYGLVSGIWNYGRLDDELGPFLEADLKSGALTESGALELLQSWFRLMAAYDNRFDNRVMLGGRGRKHPEAADRFALLAMEAVRRNRLNQPQLSLRFYAGQNPTLYAKALDVLGEGVTFPILYNDDVVVRDVMRAHHVDEETALDWLPYGCGETMLRNRSVATPNAIINLPEVLSRLLEAEERAPGAYPDFERLFAAYASRVEALLRAGALSQRTQYDVVGRETPLLFASLLYDDCVARGRPLLAGGVRYLSGTNETYGNITVSDALAALNKLVYQENKYTLAEVARALRADFKGFEILRADLLAAPKYGNDDPGADAVAVRVHDQVCRAAARAAAPAGLDHYLVVVINNWANTLLGRFTGATADGRRSGESFSNANNPTSGMDRHGVTAFLNSLLKLDTSLHAGSVQNIKFSRAMFTRDRPRLEALLSAYWTRGGSQAMITVVSRDDLESAMREPEKWGHLLVRVGGFSMRFVDLDRDVQLDILKRTLNE